MPDQLEDLKRQRALVAEHLAWLDRQIATATAQSQPVATAPAAPPRSADLPRGETVAAPPIAASADVEEGDALFARFAAEERPTLRPPSKYGCWVIFSILLLLVVGGAVALIYRAYG